jgi:flagellar basal body-associated protein FliL
VNLGASAARPYAEASEIGRRRSRGEMSKMWLIGGLVVVVALVVGAVVTALVTSRSADLLPAGSPEGVVQRYLRALEKEEYGEAFGYLTADLQRRCRVEEFAGRDHWPYSEEDQEIALEKTQTFNGSAVVRATVTVFHAGAPFGSEYSYDRTFNLKLEDGQWRLTVAREYWAGPYGYCPWF